jgi:hypothetical protein
MCQVWKACNENCLIWGSLKHFNLVVNELPTFPTVKAYIKYIKEIEQYIAYTNNKEDRYLGKWSSLLNSLK